MSDRAILIIEDEVIIAQDIAKKIRNLGYTVAGIKHSSETAIDFLSFHAPDLVLCDIHIKGEKDGIEVAETIRSTKKIPFVFLTSFSDKQTLQRAKKVLPYGYIVKPFTERDLVSSIEMALYKHAAENENLVLSKEKLDLIAKVPFTNKEYDLIINLTQGMSNSQIAAKHFISVNTVKYHMRNIVAKLEVANRSAVLHKIISVLTNS